MAPLRYVYADFVFIKHTGEIDIAESRGNNLDYSRGGWDHIGSALHWGTDYKNDHYYLTKGGNVLILNIRRKENRRRG